MKTGVELRASGDKLCGPESTVFPAELFISENDYVYPEIIGCPNNLEVLEGMIEIDHEFENRDGGCQNRLDVFDEGEAGQCRLDELKQVDDIFA